MSLWTTGTTESHLAPKVEVNHNFSWYWTLFNEQNTFSYKVKQEMGQIWFPSLHWHRITSNFTSWNVKLYLLRSSITAMFLPLTRFGVVEKKEKGSNKHLDGRKTTGLQTKVVNMTKRRHNCLVRAPCEQQRGQNCWLATTRVISPDRTLSDLSLSLSLSLFCHFLPTDELNMSTTFRI